MRFHTPFLVFLTLNPELCGWSCQVLLLAGARTWSCLLITSASAFCFHDFFHCLRFSLLLFASWKLRRVESYSKVTTPFIPFNIRLLLKLLISLSTGFSSISLPRVPFLLKLCTIWTSLCPAYSFLLLIWVRMITNNHRTQSILGCLEFSARVINPELFNLTSDIFWDKSRKFTKHYPSL